MTGKNKSSEKILYYYSNSNGLISSKTKNHRFERQRAYVQNENKLAFLQWAKTRLDTCLNNCNPTSLRQLCPRAHCWRWNSTNTNLAIRTFVWLFKRTIHQHHLQYRPKPLFQLGSLLLIVTQSSQHRESICATMPSPTVFVSWLPCRADMSPGVTKRNLRDVNAYPYAKMDHQTSRICNPSLPL